MPKSKHNEAATTRKPSWRYEDDLTLCYQVAHLYYAEDKNQSEIADLLSLSKPTIIKLLKVAKELGIVTITVMDITQTCHDLSEELAGVLGLAHAIVVPASSVSVAASRRAVAAKAAAYAIEQLTDGMTVGMGWGRTLYDLLSLIPPCPPKDIDVLTLVGGTDQHESFFQTTEMVRMFAHAVGGNASFLHAPAVLDSPESKMQLLHNQSICSALEKWNHLDLRS